MSHPSTAVTPDQATTIRALVPMAHAADVEDSIRFYALLGFEVKERLVHHGTTNWASLSSELAMLMLARASGPVELERQGVLFYLYCDDVRALRAKLVALGVADAGAFGGGPADRLPNGGRSVLFNVTTPHYMPAGELRVHDPDGYCLLVGQLK